MIIVEIFVVYCLICRTLYKPQNVLAKYGVPFVSEFYELILKCWYLRKLTDIYKLSYLHTIVGINVLHQ